MAVRGHVLWLWWLACADVDPVAVAPPGRADMPDAVDRTGPGVVGGVSRVGGVAVWAERPVGRLSTVVVVDRGDGARVLVDDGGMPDRPALSADGRRVAYVSAVTGLASLWVVGVDGAGPRQLTNAGIERDKSLGRPDGWVPPPMDRSLAWEGDALTWTAPDGAHRLETR